MVGVERSLRPRYPALVVLDAGALECHLERLHFGLEPDRILDRRNRPALAAAQFDEQKPVIGLVSRLVEPVALAIGFELTAPRPGPLRPAEPAGRARDGRRQLLQAAESPALVPEVSQDRRRTLKVDGKIRHQQVHDAGGFCAEQVHTEAPEVAKPSLHICKIPAIRAIFTCVYAIHYRRRRATMRAEAVCVLTANLDCATA